jgi:RHS repeat-associated protein
VDLGTGRLDIISNQLVRDLNNGNQVAEYTYNGAGQRIKKVTQTETRIFHYDLLGHLVAETNQSGQILAEYVYLGDQLLAMIKPGESVYYYHNDHLGTPQVLTNDSQAIAWKAVYTPFGDAVASIQTVENPFRFPGQYYDQETGLHYNYFRYYNPQTGRYITPDPIGLEGGINLFVYVAGNPINRVDPEGLIYIEIPTKEEYESRLASFGLSGLPDWLIDIMYEGYKDPDPSDLIGGLGTAQNVSRCGVKNLFKSRWFRKYMFTSFPSEAGRGYSMFGGNLKFMTHHIKYHGHHIQLELFGKKLQIHRPASWDPRKWWR